MSVMAGRPDASTSRPGTWVSRAVPGLKPSLRFHSVGSATTPSTLTGMPDSGRATSRPVSVSGDSTVNRLLGKGNRQARGSVGSQSGPPPSSSMAATTSSGAGVASGAEESAAVVAGAASSPLSSPEQPTIANSAIAARAPHRRRIGTQA